MIWTNGILSSEHARETAVQDFYSSDNQDVNIEFFGIDPNGPESNQFDLLDVEIPPTELDDLTQQQLDQIAQINPLQPANNYDIEFYERVPEIISRHMG